MALALADSSLPEEDLPPERTDDDALMRKFRLWFRKDWEHWADWRTQAKEDYAFVAGDQWSEEDRQALKENMRPDITFDRIDVVIRSVCGEQINNSQEIRYIPREQGDVKANEILTSAAEWFDDQCDAEDEDSEAFWDAAISGMGWTEMRLDVESDPDEPNPAVERIDPLEMCADCAANRRNLSDARRVWRIKQMPREEAKELYPDADAALLDAKWARNLMNSDKGAGDREDEKYDETGETGKDGDERLSDEELVTVVQCQYWTRERFYKAVDPMSGEIIELSKKQHDKLKPRLAKMGTPLKSVAMEKKVFKQAFLGREVLKKGDSPCPDHFSFNCITGFRDRNSGTFYGLVRAMKDPQRWANKWLSQTLHIMNTTAKGGVMAERGVTENHRQFAESWAKQDEITWVEDTAMRDGRIQPKPSGQFPMGFYQLMEFAISSVRDVSGVSVEMLGLRAANQPASLEMQRRQSGMTILAPLFRSLKRYYKGRGRVLLYFIQHYLSDGRLIKIVGQDKAQYVPLVKQAEAKYDIIVDEGPSSPNQKERIWGMIGEQFWTLPPPIQLALLEYSPFPESVVEKIKEASKSMSEGPQAEMQQKMAMLEAAKAEADTKLKGAQTGKTEAETAETAIDIEAKKQELILGPIERVIGLATQGQESGEGDGTAAAPDGGAPPPAFPMAPPPQAGVGQMAGPPPMMQTPPPDMPPPGGGMFSPPPGAVMNGGGMGGPPPPPSPSPVSQMQEMIAMLVQSQAEQTREIVGALIQTMREPKTVIRDEQGQVVGVGVAEAGF